jgi:hypothetical protein
MAFRAGVQALQQRGVIVIPARKAGLHSVKSLFFIKS